MPYIDRLNEIAAADCDVLRKKDAEYGGSWLRRGGVGAFMMAARKWDRLEESVRKQDYDVFKAADLDRREEGVLDDIRDLRRYLILIEAEILEQNRISTSPELSRSVSSSQDDRLSNLPYPRCPNHPDYSGHIFNNRIHCDKCGWVQDLTQLVTAMPRLIDVGPICKKHPESTFLVENNGTRYCESCDWVYQPPLALIRTSLIGASATISAKPTLSSADDSVFIRSIPRCPEHPYNTCQVSGFGVSRYYCRTHGCKWEHSIHTMSIAESLGVVGAASIDGPTCPQHPRDTCRAAHDDGSRYCRACDWYYTPTAEKPTSTNHPRPLTVEESTSTRSTDHPRPFGYDPAEDNADPPELHWNHR